MPHPSHAVSAHAVASHALSGPAAASAPSPLLNVLPLLFLVLIGTAFVLFLLGPAKQGEKYINSLADTLTDPNDRTLLLNLYRQKGAKNVVVAWICTAFFTPTIAYLYTGEYMLALLSFMTGEGFGIWFALNLFTMPFQVLARNKKAADEALMTLRLSRPQVTPILVNIAHPSST